MLAQIGEIAQIAGWIESDAGQYGRAEQAYRLGISAARETGDSTLVGNLAGSLAYQWSNTGRERESVALANAALADANEPEQAAQEARRILSAGVASERTAERSRVVSRRLKPFSAVPEVDGLLSDYGHVPAC
ncbi:hypothetical protein GCM10020000_34360 [Streptomyces olivoverticillatus]